MRIKELQLKRALRSALLVLLLSAMGMGKMDAQEFSVGKLRYSINSDGVSVTVRGYVDGYTTGALIIPPSVSRSGQTYAVTAIRNYAFYDCSGFTGNLVIPNSVITIGGYAFEGCSGFTGSLTIPNSVTTIGYNAFQNCSGFTEVHYNATNCSCDGSPFNGCGGTLVIGDEVERIPAKMFYNGGFTGSLTIGNSVTEIGNNAFSGCSGFTGDLVIPNSVTTIGGYAFSGCSGFTGILTIPNSVTTIGGSAFNNCCGFMEVHYNATNCADATWDSGCFCGCGGALVIGDEVERIPAYMFYDDGLTWDGRFTGSLTIGNSVTEIGYYAFSGCSGFTGNLVIPNSVITIGGYAFSGCSGFTGILTIPNSVTTIGSYAFNNCSGFTEVHYNAISCADADYPFTNCGGTLVIGDEVERIPAKMFYNGGFTGSLSIPNSVATIGGSAFAGCSGFTGSLTIPNSVTSIGGSVFANCSGFNGSLTIPNSVTTIGVRAFINCSGFTGSLTIPNSVTEIGSYAFSNCSGFTGSLTISNSVTTIDEHTFSGCSGFTGDLVIPNSVTTIVYASFNNCSGFTGDLVIPNSVTTISTYAFRECRGFSGSLTIPNSVTSIDNSAFAGCTFNGLNVDMISIPDSFINNVKGSYSGLLTIGNSVTTIGNQAFQNCSGFTGSLTIPNSVTEIGNYAFASCSGFTGDLTIGNSVTTIGSYAFRNCSGFTGSLTIPDSVTTIGSYAFNGCCGIDEIIMLSTTPPILGGGNVFCTTNPNFVIYVPYKSLNAYKTANYWSNYEPYIKPMFAPNVASYVSSTSNDKWTFIALPLAEDTDPAAVLNLLSEDHDYDLYQYDQSAEGEEWQNYKVDNFNLVNGRGYLYATAVDLNLIIGGEFNEDDSKEVSLDYDAGKTNAGWNLVGNPFPVDAYLNRSYYVMNASGSGLLLLPISASTPIPPCTGVFVKAEGEGETVVFTRAVP